MNTPASSTAPIAAALICNPGGFRAQLEDILHEAHQYLTPEIRLSHAVFRSSTAEDRTRIQNLAASIADINRLSNSDILVADFKAPVVKGRLKLLRVIFPPASTNQSQAASSCFTHLVFIKDGKVPAAIKLTSGVVLTFVSRPIAGLTPPTLPKLGKGEFMGFSSKKRQRIRERKGDAADARFCGAPC